MKAGSSDGFTLLEVVVSLAILAALLISLPQALLHAARAAAAARRTVQASVLASEKLEQLRGLAWGYDESGGRVEDTQSDVSRSPVDATGGTGLSPAPGDSLDSDVPGFVDYLDAEGRWLAPGTLPGDVAFVRRWSVDATPDAPAETLLLRVRVLAVAGTSGGRGLVEAARVATLKSRRPR